MQLEDNLPEISEAILEVSEESKSQEDLLEISNRFHQLEKTSRTYEEYEEFLLYLLNLLKLPTFFNLIEEEGVFSLDFKMHFLKLIKLFFKMELRNLFTQKF